MTGPEARRLGLDRALQELKQLLASWCADDQPVDFDDLTGLAVYEKPCPTTQRRSPKSGPRS